MSTEPTLAELIDLGAEEALRRVFGPMTGKVTSYDAATRTASVELLTTYAIERESGELTQEEMPVLSDVLVIFPMAGPFQITFPIGVGTTGLVIVLGDSDHFWRESQVKAEPGDLRRFHLSCVRFLPGYTADAVANPAAEENALVIKGPEIRLGDETASDFVTLDSKLQTELTKIAASLAVAVKSDLSAVPTYTPAATAATKVKAI